MSVADDAVFQQACKDAAAIIAPFAGISLIDAEQGARELGDEIRRPVAEGGQGRNPMSYELLLGYVIRTGAKRIPHEQFVPALREKANAFQESLWR